MESENIGEEGLKLKEKSSLKNEEAKEKKRRIGNRGKKDLITHNNSISIEHSTLNKIIRFLKLEAQSK